MNLKVVLYHERFGKPISIKFTLLSRSEAQQVVLYLV